MIWSIFTRRRELQKVASLEGRRDNSEGRKGSLQDVQIEQRIVKSAPALLGKAPFDSSALLNGLVHKLGPQDHKTILNSISSTISFINIMATNN